MTWNVSVTDALAHSHPPVTLGSSGAAAAAEAPVEQTKDGKLLQLISQLLRHAHLYLSPQKPVDRLTARVSVFERPWKASFLSLNDIYKKSNNNNFKEIPSMERWYLSHCRNRVLLKLRSENDCQYGGRPPS